MIEKALAGLNPVQNQAQSYYFQLYPLALTIIGEESTIPAPGTTYRFTIFKGPQKFDQTKLPIEANYKNINGVNLMVMPRCPINFYTPSFTKGRKIQYIFKMFQYQENEEYFIADYIIDIEPYINEYKTSRTVRFQHKSKFSEDYELQFEIYVQKSRFALEKVVKDYKHERSLKSPLRQRKQSSPKRQARRFSPEKKTLTSQQPTKQQRQDTSNEAEKSQREDVTQMSESRNKKAKEQQRSIKQDSKRVSVRNSRASNSVIEPKMQENKEPTNQNNEVEVQQPATFEKREESKINEKQVKTYSERSGGKAGSQTSSLNKLPIIATKLKQIAKEDTPAEIKMTESQRLGPQTSTQTDKKVQTSDKQKGKLKQQVFLTLFFIASMFLMYLAMHPNKKA